MATRLITVAETTLSPTQEGCVSYDGAELASASAEAFVSFTSTTTPTCRFILQVYAKSRRENLSQDDKQRVQALVARLMQAHASSWKGLKMAAFASELEESLTEAVAFARGEPSGVVVSAVDVPDVRASGVNLVCRSKPSPRPIVYRSIR